MTSRATPAPVDLGSPIEIKTKAESTPAFDIVVDCHEPGVGIIGKGSVGMPSRENAAIFNRAARAHEDALKAELGTVAVGVGWGIVCDHHGAGLRVYVRRFGDVDEAVQIASRWVEMQNLNLSVFVRPVIESVPL